MTNLFRSTHEPENPEYDSGFIPKKIIQNYNIGYNTNFKFEIPEAPHINYFLQNLSLPSIMNQGQDLYYKHQQTATYNISTDWSPLNINILMDEEFENYIFLMDWMRAFIDQDDYRNLIKDGYLHILSGNKQSLLTFKFFRHVSYFLR